MIGTLAALAIAGVAGAAALQYAISRNGPAVLRTVDRLAGGNGGAELKATIPTGAHPQQKLLVWGPETRDPDAAPLPVLLFAHGGSWRNGDPADYGFVGRAFVPEGFVVVLAGYRLGPDGKYPAMLEDTASAIAWTKQEISAYGGDPDRIIVAGHSAGAYNVVMVALEEQWLGRRGLSTVDIAGVVGLSGPYDFVPLDSESTIASFGHVADPQKTQPAEYVTGAAPPMLFIHGEEDTLVRPRNSRFLAQELEQAGASAQTIFRPEMDHNQPLISLAAPWRSRRDIAATIVRFARGPRGFTPHEATDSGTTSVPVKPRTR